MLKHAALTIIAHAHQPILKLHGVPCGHVGWVSFIQRSSISLHCNAGVWAAAAVKGMPCFPSSRINNRSVCRVANDMHSTLQAIPRSQLNVPNRLIVGIGFILNDTEHMQVA